RDSERSDGERFNGGGTRICRLQPTGSPVVARRAQGGGQSFGGFAARRKRHRKGSAGTRPSRRESAGRPSLRQGALRRSIERLTRERVVRARQGGVHRCPSR